MLANDPVSLKRTWESIKQIMAAGALDPLTKEMIYVAVSVTNQCGYCIASHATAARFVNSHWLALDGGSPPHDATRVLVLIEADEGVHLALEDAPAFQPLQHPLAQKPISDAAQAALAPHGVAPGTSPPRTSSRTFEQGAADGFCGNPIRTQRKLQLRR